jgi:uncharacterized membrane protein
MSNSSTYCPVPKEQQPINEYQELQNSWFFGWGKLLLPQYIAKLSWIWIWSWLVTAPLAEASYPIAKYPIQFVIGAAGGAIIFVILTVVRLYLGWKYVKDRLNQETIFYEESGWYDGQTWEKTPEILARDRLLVSYEIQPIMARIQVTFAILLGIILAGSGLWWIVN